MARIWPVIRALARVAVRDQRRLEGIRANNLFWILFLLGQGGGGAFVFLLVGIVALFPLCADPFRRLPPDRAGVWPLSSRDLRALRIASVFLSPAAWIAVSVIVWTRRPQFLLLAVLLAAFALPFPSGPVFRRMPGLFGELVRKNLREFLSLLDPYIAALLCLATVAFRPEPAALLVMSLVVVTALSTCAQSLFALDTLERYRLLPLRGWRILAAKHAALMLIALPMLLPLRPLAGIAALLTAMAIGNHMAVTSPRKQHRWSLASGALLPGLFQAAVAIAAGLHTERDSPWLLAVCTAGYVASTAFYGWRFDVTATRAPAA